MSKPRRRSALTRAISLLLWLLASVVAPASASAAAVTVVSVELRNYHLFSGSDPDYFTGSVLAGSNLFTTDLAAVVSKYIGETEKNLSEVFEKADNADAVLLFDEADALFGKRTDVKDANDRFAEDFVVLDFERRIWFGQLYIDFVEDAEPGIYELTGRIDRLAPVPIPAPGTLVLLGAGLIALARRRADAG